MGYRTTRGQLERQLRASWLLDHVDHEGSDCLIWPYGTSRGYGMLKFFDKMRRAHQLMCELAHGPRPARSYEARHSCGNGMCVNPAHLSWGTRSENQQDRTRHGTTSGRPDGGYKLTPEKVAEIRARQNIETVTSLATRFGVSRSCIRQIHLGKTWPDGVYAGFGAGGMRAAERKARRQAGVVT